MVIELTHELEKSKVKQACELLKELDIDLIRDLVNKKAWFHAVRGGARNGAWGYILYVVV